METQKSMPSRNDVEKLKADWLADPCWDIEHTEGFEANAAELKAWRLEREGKWAAETQRRQAAEDAKLQAELNGKTNLDLYKMLKAALNRIDELEGTVSELAHLAGLNND